MLRRLFAGGAVCVLVLGTGCTTLTSERQMQAARERTTLEAIEAGMARLQERVEGLDTAQQDLYRETAELRASLDERGRRAEDRLAKMEQSLAGLESTRSADRKEIVDELSRKMATIVGSSSGGSRRSSEEGYEHVVKPGETLSEIATAYNARVDSIVKANHLKNPNAIRVGQTLFIPD